jgi:hypothetical protein
MPGDVMTTSWKQLSVVFATALLVVLAADLAFARILPSRQLREVEDGVRDLEHANPDTLVLGSSHARTLHVLGGELARRTNGGQTLVAVPLENGKLVPYRWVLEHRLKPLIEEKDSNGQLVRSRLKRFVLITEWWDSCPRDDGTPYWNLPARAWTASNFFADVGKEGINGFNRNYLQNRFRRAFYGSSLVYDRTQRNLVYKLTDFLHGRPLTPSPEDIQFAVDAWQSMVEAGSKCIGNPDQMQALTDIADYVQKQRGLEMTILLFPRKPVTLTTKARATTLPQFAYIIHEFAAQRGIRVVDLTSTSPMGDDDFMEDFDHINAAGNEKFAAWALDHDLGFLENAAAPPSLAAQHTG